MRRPLVALPAMPSPPACALPHGDPHPAKVSTAIPPEVAGATATAPEGPCAGQRCLDIERCDPEKAACVPACPSGEVYIPPTGPKGFIMGKGFMTDAKT